MPMVTCDNCGKKTYKRPIRIEETNHNLCRSCHRVIDNRIKNIPKEKMGISPKSKNVWRCLERDEMGRFKKPT